MWKLRIESHLPLILTVAFIAPIFTGLTMKYIIFMYLLGPMYCTPDGKYRKVTQKSFATEFGFAANLLEVRGSTVVKVLCYRSEVRCFDSRWCHWNFSLT